jgi:hypothetical protein
MNIRYNMRDFVKKHSQLQHIRGITYRVAFDKCRGRGWHLEISISRDIMREAGWAINDYVDLEWDNCRIYFVKKVDGMYKLRFGHSAYSCHPQRRVPGRFVGCIRCVWRPNFGLPKVNPRVHCDDIRVGKTIISFAKPKCT